MQNPLSIIFRSYGTAARFRKSSLRFRTKGFNRITRTLGEIWESVILYSDITAQGEWQGAVGGKDYAGYRSFPVNDLLCGEARLLDCLKAVCGQYGNVGCTAADVPRLRLGSHFHIRRLIVFTSPNIRYFLFCQFTK